MTNNICDGLRDYHVILTNVWRPGLYNEYAEAKAWLLQFSEEDARWDTKWARTYINGEVSPSRVYFKDSADYLVFKLKFPNLLKFQ